ncbi:MAG: hypothetical protein H7144_12220, partial [Burkholderiales bacterium]|nr:hypothetical protein [Phycisphaerae bacterium]
REGRGRKLRIALACIRMLLIGLVIALLNRPVVSLTQSRTEPSVLAILIDDSLSMRVKDIKLSGDERQPRLGAVTTLLTRDSAKLLSDLAKVHQLRIYRFNSDAVAIAGTPGESLAQLEPLGQKTQVAISLRTVLRELQGQRVAGAIVFTDGRDMPQQSIAQAMEDVKDFGVPIYAVPVGSDQPLRNIEVQQVSAQDSVFVKDITNIKTTIRVTGPGDAPVVVRLRHKPGPGETGSAGKLVLDQAGRPVEKIVTPKGEEPLEVELQFAPAETGTLDLIVEAERQPGEIDPDDNSREVQIAVLDAQINVLYVDGYPRWDYRYLKNEMIRDKTVNISCLLTSADATFRQEGDKPITRFPETLEEMLEYDVLLMGDVDPREFSDAQLQLVADFVSLRGGGFGMVAGPQYAPHAWRGSAIEPILPIDATRSQGTDWGVSASTIAEGFRPAVTREGGESSLFRFFADREENDRFLKQTWQPIFWYARGVIAKPGVGEVMAEHPSEVGPDGRRAPILVTGRYGAGRTSFLAIDDSWRWRYYTGEAIFDTYWVQQLRFLARSRKLGQRKMSLASQKPIYDLGQQVRLIARVIDPQLLTQLPEQIRVQLMSGDRQLLKQEQLVRQDGGDTYLASFPADWVGRFTAVLQSVAPGIPDLTLPIEVAVPRLELSSPQVDRVSLARFASETGGQVIELVGAEQRLLAIPSAERKVPLITSQPLWAAPIALVLFILLITAEWVARKLFGMV